MPRKKYGQLAGQEYLDDLYEIAKSQNNPILLESLENFLTATVDSVLQKQAENEKLDTALRRATEKNAEIAMELEEEMEQQVVILETKIREEEQRKLDQQKQEASQQLLHAQEELNYMEEKVKSLEEKVLKKANEVNIPDSLIGEIEKKEKENKLLEKKLLEFQTHMALMRSEVAEMKTEYDEQNERLMKERGTVLGCVKEQENLTRQLHLLHEANKKLHDTNDDLRSALGSHRSNSRIDSSSPLKHSLSMVFPNQKKSRLYNSFRSDPGNYRANTLDDDTDNDEPVLPLDEDVNEASLLTELMAADQQVGIPGHTSKNPANVLPNRDIETDYVDPDAVTPDFLNSSLNSPICGATNNTDTYSQPNGASFLLDTSVPTNDREQFVKQLQVLCNTNRRLGESNDELRQALGLLSGRIRNEETQQPKERLPPTGCQSAPVTPVKKLIEVERPQSTSSPRKVLLTKSGYQSLSETRSMPDLSTDYDEAGDLSMVNDEAASEEDISTTQAENTTHVETTTYDDTTHHFCECSENVLEKGMTLCDDCLGNDSDVVVEDISLDEEETSLVSSPSVTIYSMIEDTRPCTCNQKQTCDMCTQVDDNTSLDPLKSDKSIQCDIETEFSESEITELNKSCLVNRTLIKDDEIDNPLEKSTQIMDYELAEVGEAEEIIEPIEFQETLSMDDMGNMLEHLMGTISPELSVCPTCNHTVKNETCLCSESINQLAESTILTDSDSDNYSEQETRMSNTLKRYRPIGSESGQDATYETGIGLTNDVTLWTTTGINSSLTLLQNVESELSMYARRQPDEDMDEDDMDDDELVRLVDQTNDLSVSVTDEPITVEEKILEPRGTTVGADTSSDSISRSGSEAGTSSPERMYKLVLAGDAAVGKSSFIIRLCKNKFYSALNSTLGVDFQVKTMNVDGTTVALQLWDTAGQERFRSIAKSYFRKVDGVILLYDVTCENSFMDVRDWLDSVENSSSRKVPVIICGNKTDLRPEAIARGMPVVSKQQGRKLAEDVGALFIETSAKDGTNVQKACLELTRQLQAFEDEELQRTGIDLENDKSKPKKSLCCRS